jgi:hypothetical protein
VWGLAATAYLAAALAAFVLAPRAPEAVA